MEEKIFGHFNIMRIINYKFGVEVGKVSRKINEKVYIDVSRKVIEVRGPITEEIIRNYEFNEV